MDEKYLPHTLDNQFYPCPPKMEDIVGKSSKIMGNAWHQFQDDKAALDCSQPIKRKFSYLRIFTSTGLLV